MNLFLDYTGLASAPTCPMPIRAYRLPREPSFEELLHPPAPRRRSWWTGLFPRRRP